MSVAESQDQKPKYFVRLTYYGNTGDLGTKRVLFKTWLDVVDWLKGWDNHYLDVIEIHRVF